LSEKGACGINPGYPNPLDGDVYYEETVKNRSQASSPALTEPCLCRIRDNVWDYDERGRPKFTPAAAKAFSRQEISDDCLDGMFELTKLRNDGKQEGIYMILTPDPNVNPFGSDSNLPMCYEGTQAKPFSLDYVAKPTSKEVGVMPAEQPEWNSIEHFTKEVMMRDVNMFKFRRMFQEAAVNPTGNVPQGCVKGYIVGSGALPTFIRDNVGANWNGKCFLPFTSGDTVYNVIIGTGPNMMGIPGKVDRNAKSWMDGKPCIRLRYDGSPYYLGLSRLFTNNSILIDYNYFVDELREHPRIPGMFLGVMYFAPADEIPTENFQRLFSTFLRILTAIADRPDWDGIISNTPARGDGTNLARAYAMPVTAFVLYQNEQGYRENCIPFCPEYTGPIRYWEADEPPPPPPEEAPSWFNGMDPFALFDALGRK